MLKASVMALPIADILATDDFRYSGIPVDTAMDCLSAANAVENLHESIGQKLEVLRRKN